MFGFENKMNKNNLSFILLFDQNSDINAVYIHFQIQKHRYLV